MAHLHNQQMAVPPSSTAQAANKHGDAGELLNSTLVPLHWGRSLKPFPAPHPPVNFNPMEWFWFPGFAFDIRFILSVVAFVLYVLATVVLFAGSGGITAGKSIGATVLFILASVVVYIRVNIGINQVLRTAICRCYAKRNDAVAAWEIADHRDFIYAKDVFHEEKSFFYHIVVLRDGSVEMRSIVDRGIAKGGADIEVGMHANIKADAFANGAGAGSQL